MTDFVDLSVRAGVSDIVAVVGGNSPTDGITADSDSVQSQDLDSLNSLVLPISPILQEHRTTSKGKSLTGVQACLPPEMMTPSVAITSLKGHRQAILGLADNEMGAGSSVLKGRLSLEQLSGSSRADVGGVWQDLDKMMVPFADCALLVHEQMIKFLPDDVCRHLGDFHAWVSGCDLGFGTDDKVKSYAIGHLLLQSFKALVLCFDDLQRQANGGDETALTVMDSVFELVDNFGRLTHWQKSAVPTVVRLIVRAFNERSKGGDFGGVTSGELRLKVDGKDSGVAISAPFAGMLKTGRAMRIGFGGHVTNDRRKQGQPFLTVGLGKFGQAGDGHLNGGLNADGELTDGLTANADLNTSPLNDNKPLIKDSDIGVNEAGVSFADVSILTKFHGYELANSLLDDLADIMPLVNAEAKAFNDYWAWYQRAVDYGYIGERIHIVGLDNFGFGQCYPLQTWVGINPLKESLAKMTDIKWALLLSQMQRDYWQSVFYYWLPAPVLTRSGTKAYLGEMLSFDGSIKDGEFHCGAWAKFGLSAYAMPETFKNIDKVWFSLNDQYWKAFKSWLKNGSNADELHASTLLALHEMSADLSDELTGDVSIEMVDIDGVLASIGHDLLMGESVYERLIKLADKTVFKGLCLKHGGINGLVDGWLSVRELKGLGEFIKDVQACYGQSRNWAKQFGYWHDGGIYWLSFCLAWANEYEPDLLSEFWTFDEWVRLPFGIPDNYLMPYRLPKIDGLFLSVDVVEMSHVIHGVEKSGVYCPLVGDVMVS